MGPSGLIRFKKRLPFQHSAPTSKDILCSIGEMTRQVVGRTDQSTLTILLFSQVHIGLQRADGKGKGRQTFL
jgi:hypothetical protein